MSVAAEGAEGAEDRDVVGVCVEVLERGGSPGSELDRGVLELGEHEVGGVGHGPSLKIVHVVVRDRKLCCTTCQRSSTPVRQNR